MESEADAAQQSPPAKRSKVVDHEEEEENKIGDFIGKLKKSDPEYYMFQLHNVCNLGARCTINFLDKHPEKFQLFINMRNPVEVSDCLGHVKHIGHDGISKITHDFSYFILKSSFGRFFRGLMNDKEVLVKKWELPFPISRYYVFYPQRFASQLELLLNRDVNSHPCVAKLIGFCCEKFLAFVWDLSLDRTLHCLVPQDSFTWDQRMRVAGQVAETLDFFHKKKIAICNFFSPSICVDWDYNIQLFELDFSVNLAKEKVPEKFCWASFPYFSPEADAARSKFPDDFEIGWFYASDVYHFGLLLLELTLAKCVDSGPLAWVESGKQAFEKALACSPQPQPQKIKIFGLAMKCLQREPRLRPKMDEVVQEFRTIVLV